MRDRVRHIIERLGGVEAVRDMLRLPRRTTVDSWIARGRIPWWRQQQLLAAAQARGFDLKAEDFFVTASESDAAPASVAA